jgi:ABC-2 type transport system ATP-binding protein
MSEVILRAKGLAKRFGHVQALHQVDLELIRGKLTVFLGENGAGKTTTLKIILGFLFPDAGSVDKIQPGLRIGYVPELPAFFPWLKGEEILGLTAGLFGLGETESKKRRDEAAAFLSFDLSQLKRRVRTYSHGNQKKMAYLQSMLLDPDLLMVDEPFTALDPVAIKQVRDLFIRLREAGKTVFISSHLISEAEKLADQVIIIKQGRTLLQVDWPEFVQKGIYVRARRVGSIEKIIRDRWPESQTSDDWLEGFILRREWEEFLSGLNDDLKEAALKDVEIRPPDLESFFLFWNRYRSR